MSWCRIIAVSAREEIPSRRRASAKDDVPLHWMLLTTEGKADLDTARTVLRWYELRWRIRDFFEALKAGTHIGDRRIRKAGGQRNCFAFDAITAFRVWDLSFSANGRADDL